MKFKISLLAGLAALGFASSANAQTVINITGATAFRAAMNTTIRTLLDDSNPGTAKYAWVGTPGLSGYTASNRVIVEGNIGGQPFIIRTSQSGSTQGIQNVVLQTTTPTAFLGVAQTAADRTTTGTNLASDAGKTAAGVIPRFAFSDVSQDISNNPTPALPGSGVGVVPFVFVANVGAPAGLTAMTDQLHEAQWSLGQLPLSMYTGNPSDVKNVLNTGRNNGSGTRATILAETQYGPFRTVVQWGGPNDATSDITGLEGTGTVATLASQGNNGYSSNLWVRKLIARSSAAVSVAGGAAQDIIIVSYLTLSDAAVVTTITGNPGVGAKALTYNGVAYSENNVKNGAYTLWGYQQFYGSVDITAAETTFFNAFVAGIQPNLDPLATGIRTTEMNVTRDGGDGGIITPGI